MGTEKRARQKELHRTRAEEARKAAAAQVRRRRIVNAVLVVVLAAIVGGGVVLLSRDDDTTTADGATTTTAASSTSEGDTATTTTAPPAEGTAECPAADGSSDQRREFDGPPKMCIDPAKTYTAKVETNMGDFTITFDDEKAPTTVNNFVFLARYHYFDGLTFHRIIKDFVIQGGDPEGTGAGGPGYEFADELPQQGEYEKYSLAMANSGPNTNGSQFFVITGDQGIALPPSYSLFGKVTDGTDVVDEIGTVKTGEGDKPEKDVVMEKVTISES